MSRRCVQSHVGERVHMMQGIILALIVVAALGVSRLPAAEDLQTPLSRMGGKLAYVSTDGELLVLDAATGTRRLLVSGMNQRIRDPRWSPDGNQIAYLSAPRVPGEEGFIPSRIYDVYTVPADGGAPRKLTDEAENMHRLSWFPDGRRLLYQTGFNGYFRIHTVNSDGSGRGTFPLPSGGSYAHQIDATLSPDGS
jgi:Tol biopolymer transport system component